MRRRIMVAVVAAGASALAVAASPGGASATVAAGSGAVTPAGRVTPRGAVSTQRVVTTVTGDRVRLVHRDGRTLVQVVPTSAAPALRAVQTVHAGRHVYVIPTAARPYFGRTLDPSLFDVARRRPGGRIAVTFSYAGRHVPHVPGVTVTAHHAGVGTGYLTSRSAASFGAALLDRYRDDARHGFPTRHRLFGVTDLAVAGAAAPTVKPDYPQRTLVLRLLGTNGKPVRFGFVDLYDTAAPSHFFGFAIVSDGVGRISVPIGTYGMDTAVGLPGRGGAGGFAIVTKFGVHVHSQNQVVRLNGHTATSRLSVHTPRPADSQSTDFDVDVKAHRFELDSGYEVGPGQTIKVSPTASPKSVDLTSRASWVLQGTPSTGTPYAYVPSFAPRPGIPADESYKVAASSLSTYDWTFYGDGYPGTGQLISFAFPPHVFFASGTAIDVQLPSHLTVYFSGAKGTTFDTSLLDSPVPNRDPFLNAIDDAGRLPDPGLHVAQDWARGPVQSQVIPPVGDTKGFFCPSCRSANRMVLAFDLAADTTPGHGYELVGVRNHPVVHMTLYRDGKPIAKHANVYGLDAKVPAGRSTYRIFDSVDRRPDGAYRSTRFTNSVTFRSAAGKGRALPRGWVCEFGKNCTTLPLLRAAVQLPTNLLGNVPRGTSTIALTLGHVAGGVAPNVTSGQVQVRPTGTKAWTALPTTAAGNGVYDATLHAGAGAADRTYDLRVIGTDDRGGRIVQTTTAAFGVQSS